MSPSLENLKIGFIASGRMPQAMIKGILGSGESGLLIRQAVLRARKLVLAPSEVLSSMSLT